MRLWPRFANDVKNGYENAQREYVTILESVLVWRTIQKRVLKNICRDLHLLKQIPTYVINQDANLHPAFPCPKSTSM